MAIDSTNGVLYSSSCDGSIKYWEKPLLEQDNSSILMKTDNDVIGALACVDGDLFTGDDKGVVIRWINNKIGLKYNLIEEVKSFAIENTWLYTARDLDAVITDLLNSQTGKYVTLEVIPGRDPVLLMGPVKDKRTKYLVFATRDGKGITVVRNERGFKVRFTKQVSFCFCYLKIIPFAH